MESLREVIKRRDEIDDASFDEMLEEFKDNLEIGEDPEEALQDVFGIEPDYIFDPDIMRVMESLP